MIQRDNCTAHKKYLESQLDAYRAAEERRQEDSERQRQARNRQRRDEYNHELRTAANWPDALNKNRILSQNEVNGDDEDDRFFESIAAACAKALEIWAVVEADNQTAIDNLDQKIAAIHDRIRLEVADQLQSADSRSEFAMVADQMRGDDLVSFLDW